MTIDEAIKHYIDIAESCECEAGHCDETDRYECHVMHELGKCAADHRQLAEWLKELKELRAKSTHSKWIPKYDDKHGFHYICGNCNAISGTKTTFCFDCGADMKQNLKVVK